MPDPTYSIQELCEQSGLPRRTIHFYIQQGLLPPASGAGLGARYGEEHRLRLQLIAALRARGLRLDEIRNRLHGLDLPALKQMLENVPPPPTPPALQPVGRSYTHYPLPAGWSLVVPAALGPGERQQLAELLAAAQKILSSPQTGSSQS